MTRTYSGARISNVGQGNQTLFGQGIHIITFGAAAEDIGGWFDAGSPNQLTVPEGVTRVTAYGSFKMAGGFLATDLLSMEITRNGVVITPSHGGGAYRLSTGFFGTWTMTTPAILAVEDDIFQLRLNAKVFAGVSLTILASLTTTLAVEAVVC